MATTFEQLMQCPMDFFKTYCREGMGHSAAETKWNAYCASNPSASRHELHREALKIATGYPADDLIEGFRINVYTIGLAWTLDELHTKFGGKFGSYQCMTKADLELTRFVDEYRDKYNYLNLDEWDKWLYATSRSLRDKHRQLLQMATLCDDRLLNEYFADADSLAEKIEQQQLEGEAKTVVWCDYLSRVLGIVPPPGKRPMGTLFKLYLQDSDDIFAAWHKVQNTFKGSTEEDIHEAVLQVTSSCNRRFIRSYMDCREPLRIPPWMKKFEDSTLEAKDFTAQEIRDGKRLVRLDYLSRILGFAPPPGPRPMAVLFRDHGIDVDPILATNEWHQKAVRPASEREKHKWILQIAHRRGEGSARHYLRRLPNIGANLRRDYNSISRHFGFKPVESGIRSSAHDPKYPLTVRRIAILTQFDVPSTSYHWQIVNSIIDRATDRAIGISVHKTDGIEIVDAVASVLRHFKPDAIIVIRLSPSDTALNELFFHKVPVVLVHADKTTYNEPVLANIVPSHEEVPADIARWFNQFPTRSGKIVVIHMPTEKSKRSIRNERIEVIRAALKNSPFHTVNEEVPDYSFRHAIQACHKHSDAQGYIALSDEIAVGIKHILETRGKYEPFRVVGFDNSQLAQTEHIPSFDQQLSAIGEMAIETICEFVYGDDSTPRFDEAKVEVKLSYN